MTRTACTVVKVFVAIVAVVSASRSGFAEEKDRLIGTWKLVAAVSEELATGQKTNIYKGTPVGYITYGTDGRMMVIVVDSGRKKPAEAVATGPESEALFRTMSAYGGTYTIKGSQIIHHVDVSWNESWTDTDQIRNYKFDGERLSLATAPSPNPFTGKMSVRTLVWEKLK